MLSVSGVGAVSAPVEIDFRTVEAAALMHVEAGLLDLQSLGVASADTQFSAATRLVEWSHELRGSRLTLLTKWRDLVRTPSFAARPASGEPDPVPPE
jgi:hypothetical protein